MEYKKHLPAAFALNHNNKFYICEIQLLRNINLIMLIKLLQCKGVRKYITVIYFNGVFLSVHPCMECLPPMVVIFEIVGQLRSIYWE